jgi:hypothetical protein
MESERIISVSQNGGKLCYDVAFLKQLQQRCASNIDRRTRRRAYYCGVWLKHKSITYGTIVSTRISERTHKTTKNCVDGVNWNNLHKINRNADVKTEPKKSLPKVLLANVQSAQGKLDEITELVINKNPDIAVFSESWLNVDHPDEPFSIVNYNMLREDRKGRRGGGIIIYSKNELHVENCTKKLRDDKIIDDISEMIVLFYKQVRVLLIAIYHPYWKDAEANNRAILNITAAIDWCLAYKHPDSRLIITGDFNDLRLDMEQIENMLNVIHVVTFPTRGDNTLDQILTNMGSSYKKPRKLPPIGKSDHCVIIWEPRKIKRLEKKTTKVEFLDCKPHNKLRLLKAINQVNWEHLVQLNLSLDDLTNVFFATLKSIVEATIPLKSVTMKTTDRPWISPYIKYLINKRNRYWHNGNMDKYREFREIVIKAIHSSKNSFLKNSLAKAAEQEDPRAEWAALNKVCGLSQKMQFNVHQLWNSDLDMAEELNKYFASVLVHDADGDYNKIDITNLPSHCAVISIGQVKKEILKLKRKATGIDDIPNWIFVEAVDFLVPTITYIFNKSLQEMKFPTLFKFVNLCAVPKEQTPTKTDFRPISILVNLSKILERLAIQIWLYPYCNFSNNEFAFVTGTGLGTNNALTVINHIMLKYLDQPGAVRMFLLDFSKAFDKCKHSIIIKSLVDMCVPFEAVCFIHSFLIGRTQRVKVGKSYSDWTAVTSGIPQGSVLGPMCFAAVMHSFSAKYHNTHIIKYADDCTILHCFRTINEDLMQEEINHIQKWCVDYGMTINDTKTKELHINNRHNISLTPLTLTDGKVIKVSHCEKLLGIVFQDDLKWNTHVEQTILKASKRLFYLRLLKLAGAFPQQLWNVYNARIRSVLSYAFPATCNMPDYLVNDLLRIESRAQKIIGVPNDVGLMTHLNNTCLNLMSNIEKQHDHRLRLMFVERQRGRTSIVAPAARTSRFTNSFIKFARQL